MGVISFVSVLFLISYLIGFSWISTIISSLFLFVVSVVLKRPIQFNAHKLIVFFGLLLIVAAVFFVFFHFVGKNIYGIPIDFAFHNSIVASISNGGNFPPAYPMFSKAPLTYYYFTDLFVAAFVSLGLNTILATYLALSVGALSVFSLIFYISSRLGGKKAGLLALFLFVFAGSLFFIPFFDTILSESFQIVPASYFSSGFVFDNLFIESLLIQRNFIFPIALFLSLLLVFIDGSKNKKYFYLTFGPLIGLSFGWHPFVAITASILFVLSGLLFRTFKNKYFWASLLLLSAFASPFLLFFAGKAAVSPSFSFGFLAVDKSLFGVLVFWLQNIGALFLPALVYLIWKGSFTERIIFISVLPAFLVVNFFNFFVFRWDSIKFIYPLMYVLILFSAVFFIKVFEFKRYLALLVIPILFFATFGGGIVVYSFFSQSQIPFFEESDLKGCEFIEANVPVSATLLTNNEYTCAYGLLGRKVFLGEKFWIETHGFNYTLARAERNAMLGGNCSLIKKYGLTYLYTGGVNGDVFSINRTFLESTASLLYKEREVELWKLNC